MKYYRYLFLAVALAYIGCFFVSNGLVYQQDTGGFEPVSTLDSGFLNDNFSLLLVAASALATFVILSVRSFGRDGTIMVTVLSFILQFGSFAWIDKGSVYATALEASNGWLLAGLVLQVIILLVISVRMIFD